MKFNSYNYDNQEISKAIATTNINPPIISKDLTTGPISFPYIVTKPIFLDLFKHGGSLNLPGADSLPIDWTIDSGYFTTRSETRLDHTRPCRAACDRFSRGTDKRRFLGRRACFSGQGEEVSTANNRDSRRWSISAGLRRTEGHGWRAK